MDDLYGIYYELDHVLGEDWKLYREGRQFRVHPPPNVASEGDSFFRAEAWRIAQFIAYAAYVSIRRRKDGGYVITSHNGSGLRFRIDVETKPNQAPDHRLSRA